MILSLNDALLKESNPSASLGTGTTMQCYYCNKEVIKTGEDRTINSEINGSAYYSCDKHQYPLHLHCNTVRKNWHLVSLRCEYNKHKLQIYWYLRDGLHMFRIYGDEGEYPLLLELKDGIEYITPDNIDNKIAMLLTFS